MCKKSKRKSQHGINRNGKLRNTTFHNDRSDEYSKLPTQNLLYYIHAFDDMMITMV